MVCRGERRRREGEMERKEESNLSPSNNSDVNFEEIARCTNDFNGAQLKAVCVEAGMIALRRKGDIIKHEDFMEGIAAVQAKKKAALQYYA
jgi:26S proteasome regulatory subunit T5